MKKDKKNRKESNFNKETNYRGISMVVCLLSMIGITMAQFLGGGS